MQTLHGATLSAENRQTILDLLRNYTPFQDRTHDFRGEEPQKDPGLRVPVTYKKTYQEHFEADELAYVIKVNNNTIAYVLNVGKKGEQVVILPTKYSEKAERLKELVREAYGV